MTTFLETSCLPHHNILGIQTFKEFEIFLFSSEINYHKSDNTGELLMFQHDINSRCTSIASFPGLPHFHSSVCVQYNARKRKSAKNREGLGNTYHVNEIRWTQGGRRGGGVRSHEITYYMVLDFIIERSIARQDPRRSQDHEYSA